jgi:hypothetical protein
LSRGEVVLKSNDICKEIDLLRKNSYSEGSILDSLLKRGFTEEEILECLDKKKRINKWFIFGIIIVVLILTNLLVLHYFVLENGGLGFQETEVL